jgi:hypothetical protein
MDLVLEQPSEITLELPILPPPYNFETTNLVGGVQTTITTKLGLLQLLGAFAGKAIPADIAVDDVLIAGTEIVLGGSLPLGTLCVAQDPENPSSGMAYLNPLLGVAEFEMALNTMFHATDPYSGPLLGGPVPFVQEVSAITPLTIGDMLDLLGGGGGGLSLSQPVDAELGPLPLFGMINITGTLTLATADAPPSDPLIDECEAYLAGL